MTIKREGGRRMKNKLMQKKLLLAAPILLGIVLMLFFGTAEALEVFDKGEEKIMTSSTLMDVIDISNLSTAQFTYNGIAEIYKDKKQEKVKCYIRYNAKVKAGIDMKEVQFKIDEEKKTVKPILPEIKINSNPVDEKSLSFIPADSTIELKDALVACKEDAEREAMESQELLDSAEENLKAIIEGLLYPILDSQGYSILWD